MIVSPDARGRAFALLGFDAAEPLLPQLRLRLDQPEQLRGLVRAAASECRRPFYYPKGDLWMDDADRLDALVWERAPDWIGPDDIAALKRWFAQGQGYPEDDPATSIWWRAVTRIEGGGWNKDGLEKPQAVAVDQFITDVWNAWRDQEFEELSEELRDAEQSEAEMELADRFNINFYDDVLDPLHVLWDLRKGNILHQMLDRYEAQLPMDQLRRLTDAYLETEDGRGWNPAQIAACAGDIRTIRAAADG